MSTQAIAKRWVELCREGRYEDAQRELYAEDGKIVREQLFYDIG
jgi:hypothetical protein